MPQINRIRIANVAFNGNRSHFKDFKMSFFGKSGTYDLYNGGGKSVLLLMLLQTVLPGSTLDKEQPLKNIFLNTPPNHTSHALIEWILDEGAGFKYLVTGFCVRAKKDATQESSEVDEDGVDVYGIEYYNYYHLYNAPNDFDIDHIELVSHIDQRISCMGFESLKTLLDQIRKTESIDLYSSRKLKEYKRFLRHYGIIDAEWKMIKDLNQDENYITRYFRANDTSRKLIENLLISFIEDVERNAYQNVEDSLTSSMLLAKGLLEIRENLNQLYKDKEQREDFLRVRGYYEQINILTQLLSEDYLLFDDIRKQFVMVAHKLKEITDELALEIEIMDLDINQRENELQNLHFSQDCIKVQSKEIEKSKLDEDIESLEQVISELEVKRSEAEKNLNEAMAQNSYCDFKDVVEEIITAETDLDNLNKSESEIDQEWLEAGYNYRIETEKLLVAYETKLAEEDKCVKSLQEAEETLHYEKIALSVQKGEIIGHIQAHEDLYKSFEKEFIGHKNALDQNGYSLWLLQPSEGIHELTKQIADCQEQVTSTGEKISHLEEEMRSAKELKIGYDNEIKVLDVEMVPFKSKLEEFQQAKVSFQGIAFAYHFKGDAPSLYKTIDLERSDLETKRYSLKVDKEIAAQKEHLLIERGYYIPNQEIIRLHQYLEGRLGNTFLGAEWLNNAENTEELLVRNPLLPYSVIVTGKNFEKLKANLSVLGNKFGDYAIPIQNLDLIRSGKDSLDENILFSTGSQELYTNKDQFREYTNALAQEQAKLDNDLSQISNDIASLRENLKFLESYIALERQIPEIEAAFSRKNLDRANLSEKVRQQKKRFDESQRNLSLNQTLKIKHNQKLDELIKISQRLNDYLDISSKMSEIEYKTQEFRQKQHGLQRRLEQKDEDIQKAKAHLTTRSQSLIDLKTVWGTTKIEAESLTQFKKGVGLEVSYEVAKSKYFSLNSRKSGVNHDREEIQKRLKRYRERRNHFINALKNYGFDVEYFSQQESLALPLIWNSPEKISLLQRQKKMFNDDYINKDKICNDLARKSTEIAGRISGDTDRMMKDYNKEYVQNKSVQTLEEADLLSKELQNSIEGNGKRLTAFIIKRNQVKEKKKNYDNEYLKFTGPLTEYGDLTNEIADDIQEFEKINDRFKKIKDRIQRSKDNLSLKIKNTIDEARELSVYNYAKPIEKFILPNRLSEAQELLSGITECIRIITAKIIEMDEEIETLEGYRENHVNLCLQRAEEIMLELKKLNTLPAITINGKLENMVKIEFKDFSDEDKRGRMGEYITSLAQGEADVKTLSKKLSAKYLLDRITDLDKAKVKLFKVEADYEESRYLDWKYAVGSTGQKSALYINFLISLISFIRLIGNQADFGKSSKVLILDNPYATFSSPYLWDPIFKILQENNVQLIAPGHQINARIVSRFDINYILGEDVSSKRNKIIIKDVRTEVDMNQMEFDKLEYSQESLF